MKIPSSYRKITQRAISNGVVAAWSSNELTDDCWDEFLKQTPLGQFQQSSMWAGAKHSDGWRPLRVIFTREQGIVGGFQLLTKSSWWGALGYVSKGPVILPDEAGLSRFIIDVLKKTASEQRLWGLVVQPPDLCQGIGDHLAGEGFIPDVVSGVNEATWLIDFDGAGLGAVEGRMSRTTRRLVKQAKRLGVTIREGGREDLGAFFRLMSSTCERQGVAPSPANDRFLYALWDAAEAGGSMRLTFAESEGTRLSALVSILFGRTATLWKKGWTSTGGEYRPNDLMLYEMLEWAESKGFEVADFTAFDVDIALRLFKGEDLSSEQERSRHMFHMRFGGRPMALPEARIYFPNPLVRWTYHVRFRKKIADRVKRHQLTAELRRSQSNLPTMEHCTRPGEGVG